MKYIYIHIIYTYIYIYIYINASTAYINQPTSNALVKIPPRPVKSPEAPRVEGGCSPRPTQADKGGHGGAQSRGKQKHD